MTATATAVPVGSLTLGEPPHNIAAEMATLGAMLDARDPAWLLRVVATGLEGQHFYRSAHGAIYDALMRLFMADSPTDPVTVGAALDKAGWPAGVTHNYLHDLYAAGIAENGGHHARIVLGHARRRLAIEEAARALQQLANPAVDLDEELGRATAAFGEITRTATPDAAPEWAVRMRVGGGFVLDAPASPPAVWGDGDRVLWSEGEALLIAGPPGVGKTTLVGQLVAGRLGLGSGRLFSLPVIPGARRVLYLAMDRPPQIARALARLFGPEDRAVLDDRLIIWPGPPPGDFAAKPDLLAQMCEQAGADTVVVDSIKDCVSRVSEDASGNGYNQARQRALAAGVQVVELHHQRKATSENRKPSKLDDVFGSVWITAGAGSVVLLWGEAGDPIVELTHLKQPSEPLGPWRVMHDHAAGRSALVDEVDLVALCHPWRPDGANSGLTLKDAAAALFDVGAPSAAQVEKARRQLDRFVRDGELTRLDGAPGGVGVPARYFRPSEIGAAA